MPTFTYLHQVHRVLRRQWRIYPLRNSKSRNQQPHMSSANRPFCLPSPVAKSCTVVGSEKQWHGQSFQQAQAFNKDHGIAQTETAPKQNATYMHCIFRDCCMAELNERLLKIDHKRHCLPVPIHGPWEKSLEQAGRKQIRQEQPSWGMVGWDSMLLWIYYATALNPIPPFLMRAALV